MQKLKSLQLKFVMALVLVTGALACVAGFAAYQIGFSRALDSGRQNLDGLLKSVEKTAAVAVFAADAVLMRELVDGLALSGMVSRVRLVNTLGDTLATSEQLALTPVAVLVPAGIDIQRELYSPFDKSELLGAMRVTVDMGTLRQAATQNATDLAMGMVGLIVVLAWLVGLLVQRQVSRPMAQVAGALADLPPGTSAQIPVPSGHLTDEIGDLVHSTNLLLSANHLALNREKELRAQVESLEAMYRNLFQASSAGMLVLAMGHTMKLLHANQAALRMLNTRAPAAQTDQDPPFAQAFADPMGFMELVLASQSSGQVKSADLELAASNPHARWVHCLVTWRTASSAARARAAAGGSPGRATDAAMPLVEVVAYDISDRKHAEGAVRHLAEHDTLTGLKNRVSSELAIDRMLVQGPGHHVPFTLMYIDLDGFKQVNDTLGHKAGDQVLVVVAQRMRQAVRRGSDLCARIGGDEFLVALPCADSNDPYVCEVATALLQALSAPMLLDDGAVAHIGASIGLACYPLHGNSRKGLLHVADLALYEVKRTGRNGFAMATQHLHAD